MFELLYGMVKVYLAEIRELANQRSRQILEIAAKALRRQRIEHDTHIAHGNTARLITSTARRLKCKSIIMGTRGLGALGSLTLGSVAMKVVHLASQQVTLVK